MGRGLSPLQRSILHLAITQSTADTEPRPVAYRVTVGRTTWEWYDGRLHRNPIDLRQLVPEAFTPADPDGYWSGDSVIASSFADYGEAQARAEELRPRGVDEVPPRRGQVGLASYVSVEVVRRERQDEAEWSAYSARTLAQLLGKSQESPDPRHAPGTIVPDVYGWEVLATVGGLPLRLAAVPQPPSGYPAARFSRDHWDRLGRHRPGRFEKHRCGAARYNVAQVTTHRAIDRLVQRGLVIRFGTGFNLTEAGRSTAQEVTLMAKSPRRVEDLAVRSQGAGYFANG